MKSRVLLLVPLSLALVVGCSADTTTGSPETAESPRPAATESAREPTRYATIGDLNAALSKQQIEDGTARFDISGNDPENAMTGSGVVRMDDAGPASSVTLQMPADTLGAGGETQVVSLPGEFYVRFPPGQEPEPGKPWLKITPGGTDPLSQLVGPILGQLNSTADPTSQLKLYEEAFTLAGATKERRDGDPVMVYDIDVDAQRLAELTAERSGLPVPGGAGALPQGTDLSLTYVVDGEDRLRESVTTLLMLGRPIEIRTTFSGWGEPVDITPPPADQIAELPGS